MHWRPRPTAVDSIYVPPPSPFLQGDTDVAICWREGEDDYSLHDGYNTPGGHKFKMDDDSATSSNQLQLIRESTFVLDDQFHCRLVGRGK